MNLISKGKKYNWLLLTLVILTLSTFLVFCHKSPGAICNDGWRSHSIGCGACSWHGGVDHYIDTNEISIPKTAGLIIILVLAGRVFISSDTKKNKY